MTKPGFIVEGRQEQGIVQQLCPGCKVETLDSNGKSVTYENLAKQIHIVYGDFGNRYHPVFVIFDRERREETVEEIIERITIELEKLQSNVNSTYIFGIPDRKLESWILPFVGEDGNILEFPTDEHEGSESLTKLKYRLNSADTTYKKTSIGVSLFVNSVEPNKLAKISPSFKKLFDSGREHCRWFNNSVKMTS